MPERRRVAGFLGFPLLFSTGLARATTPHGFHFDLINARSSGAVPWHGKFADS